MKSKPTADEPLSIEEFCKYEGLDYNEVMALPFDAFLVLIKKHGFFLTGNGLIPKDYGATVASKGK